MSESVHQCHQCGMSYSSASDRCPKCDYGRFEHNKSQRMVVDIAHNRQTVDIATQQFYEALDRAKRELFFELEVIVGGGLINEEIAHLLETEVWRETIRNYRQEPHNRGAYILRLI
jgi:predicted ATP-dependent serine protease